jgi:predicted DNA-binding ribbon-helix-helix protein
MRDAPGVRTTLTLEDDIYAAARALARQRGVSLGQIISELSREALRGETVPLETRNNLRLFPRRNDARPVTPELVKQLLDEVD